LTKGILNYIIIIVVTLITFKWTFFIFHREEFDFFVVLTVISIRLIFSRLLFKDYNLSWSKVSQKTFLTKSFIYILSFFTSLIFLYTHIEVYFLASELFLYLFSINFIMYSYQAIVNHVRVIKTKTAIIYGAGDAGLKILKEFANSEYKVLYFCDDDKKLQNKSIDNISILSCSNLKELIKNQQIDLLIIAIPSLEKSKIKTIHNDFNKYFNDIKILPPLSEILKNDTFSKQLKDISVEDLLARNPKDLDKKAIQKFIKDKTILITGAGGSIGSEIVRQCINFNAKELILIDHSEYNLYTIEQEVLNNNIKITPIMVSVVDLLNIERVFQQNKIDLVIHAAAYKHVPLCEQNIYNSIQNNVIGTKNIIDISCKYNVEKIVLISTDKAVRPTNVMGTTKRICELYAQNKVTNTEIVAVRFGNVLGSSGSVIPKFKSQIENNQPITVTHPDITRYFMLIPEACELVLQAGSLGSGGEIFILDMGEPIKIIDLAKKMIELSNKDIKIEFTGLRPGEKLYEELLINETDASTKYESIMVAKPTFYDIDKLNKDINKLIEQKDDKEELLKQLKLIVPEFNHMRLD
jgi:UDP-N-acetyl-D-glucosamine 4,6-dehydratase